jgi:hypothetical protein
MKDDNYVREVDAMEKKEGKWYETVNETEKPRGVVDLWTMVGLA